MTRCYELTTTTRPYQRNVKTGTLIYQRPTSAFRNNCPWRLSNGIQRPDRISAYQHQTSSCISTTRPTPATLVERPAANIYNATIPANDVTHPSWNYIQPPWTSTYMLVNTTNKLSLVIIVISPLFLHCVLAVHTFNRITHLRGQRAYRLRNICIAIKY